MRTIIVVGANTNLISQVMLSAHSHCATKCFIICGTHGRGLRFSTLCSRYLEISLNGDSDETFVQIVHSLSEENPGIILVPADCDGARIANRTIRKLKVKTIPIPSLSMLKIFDDKWNFYRFCISNKFNAPPTIYVGKKEDLEFERVFPKLGLPFVLKPVNEGGSNGVRVIYNKRYFLREILNNNDYQYAPLIAQQYISGADGGLNVISISGELRAMAIQKYVGGELEFVSNPYLEAVAGVLCKVSGYNGVMNIDVRINENSGKTYFTDANPRFWGSTFASTWSGINFVEESLNPSILPGIVLKMTSGKFSGSLHEKRHPIFYPSVWSHLLKDKENERGRMARAMIFDMYILPKFIQSLPSRTIRYYRKCLSRGYEMVPHI